MAGWEYSPSSGGGSVTTAINDSPTVNATDTDGSYTLQTTMIIQPCRVVSFYPLLANGLINIDSVQLNEGDRVLLVNQADPTKNGIYIASIDNWTRSPDFNSTENIKSRALIPIAEGDINHSTSWSLVTPDPIVLGTSNLIFEKVMYGSHNGIEIPFSENDWGTTPVDIGGSKVYELTLTHNLNTLRADITIFQTNDLGEDEIIDVSDIDFVSLNTIRLRIPYSSNMDLRFDGYIFMEPNR